MGVNDREWVGTVCQLWTKILAPMYSFINASPFIKRNTRKDKGSVIKRLHLQNKTKKINKKKRKENNNNKKKKKKKKKKKEGW